MTHCDCTMNTDHATMVATILHNYHTADPTMVADGLRWYSDAESTIAADAAAYGVPYSTAAAVYAAASINASWKANVTIARRWLQHAMGGDRPSCLAMVADRCERAIAERPETFEHAWTIVLGGGDGRGSKVGSFVSNFHGRTEYVTVDRWAMVGAGVASTSVNPRGKVTPCDTHSKAPKGPRYARIADAYRAAAAVAGVAPRDLQAAVWVAVRGSAN